MSNSTKKIEIIVKLCQIVLNFGPSADPRRPIGLGVDTSAPRTKISSWDSTPNIVFPGGLWTSRCQQEPDMGGNDWYD